MTQQLGHLGQRSATPKHVSGQAVAEQVRTVGGRISFAFLIAQATTVEIAAELANPTRGALSRMKMRRVEQRGRPARRYGDDFNLDVIISVGYCVKSSTAGGRLGVPDTAAASGRAVAVEIGAAARI